MQRRNDLLHQLSNTTYEVNAQGRTETWYRVIPSQQLGFLEYQFVDKQGNEIPMAEEIETK